MIKFRIVLVPFPFDDFSTTKVRPAICLTEPIGAHEHVVIAFISSKLPEEVLTTDIVVKRHDPYFNTSGLQTDSVIRLHKIVTVPKRLFQRELGRADNDLTVKILDTVKRLFGV